MFCSNILIDLEPLLVLLFGIHDLLFDQPPSGVIECVNFLIESVSLELLNIQIDGEFLVEQPGGL